jgi:hypothetical protein
MITNFFNSSDLRYKWNACVTSAVNSQKHCLQISGQCYRQATKTATGDKSGYQKDHSRAMVKSTMFIDTIPGRGSMIIPIWNLRLLRTTLLQWIDRVSCKISSLVCSIHIGGKLQRRICCSMVENP